MPTEQHAAAPARGTNGDAGCVAVRPGAPRRRAQALPRRAQAVGRGAPPTSPRARRHHGEHDIPVDAVVLGHAARAAQHGRVCVCVPGPPRALDQLDLEAVKRSPASIVQDALLAGAPRCSSVPAAETVCTAAVPSTTEPDTKLTGRSSHPRAARCAPPARWAPRPARPMRC